MFLSRYHNFQKYVKLNISIFNCNFKDDCKPKIEKPPPKTEEELCKGAIGPCDMKTCTPKGQKVCAEKEICLYNPCLTTLPTCVADVPGTESKPAEWVPPTGPKIIIIGAGMAGLTAADQLLKNGINNLVILEADTRVGGRVKSVWAGDTVAEMGLRDGNKKTLSWDHPLLRIGLESCVISPPTGGVDPTAGLLDVNLSLPVLFRTFTSLKDLKKEMKRARIRSPEYIHLRAEQEGRRSKREDSVMSSRVMASISALISSRLRVFENAFGAYAVGPGGSKVPLGEGAAIASLVESLGPNRILFHKEAMGIRWGTVTMDQTPRVLVRCRDGTEYSGEYLLITCSLGSLKTALNTMFYPPLPQEKAKAIEALTFEQENKAFLIYDEPFWVWAPEKINFQFSKEEREKRKGWAKGVSEIKEVPGSERTIEVTVKGPEARLMERAPIDEVTDILHSLLQTALNVGELSKPIDTLRSEWSTKRYFSGFYCADEDKTLRSILACPLPSPDPLPPVILFAGEASAPKPAGLRGASISGLREANRLIDIFKKYHSQELPEPCPIVCPT